MHNIIPEPVTFEAGKGFFTLTASTRIKTASTSKELSKLADFLESRLRLNKPTDSKDAGVSKQKVNSILLQLSEINETGKEGYKLTVDKKQIVISANTGKGIFYGIQTLLQLMPDEVEDRNPAGSFSSYKIPSCQILDYPRFEYRGMHLDVCRHFFPVEFIKKYIDLLAMYKINNFHWHLTEDQGWRLEIKKYPLLTEVGAWRSSTPIGRNAGDDNMLYGGFYTQKEAREVVAYAAERYVNVVPEIEMPGHALAALAAYPELSCTGGPFEVWTKWGVIDDIYCAGNEKVFTFLEEVLTEVMNIFPSTYIHIGGDEAPKNRWEACPLCQKRIHDEHLKDPHELQSYFITRIEKFLNSNGRQIIGWDEILEGGLAPGATVMSWRGIDGGIAAAKMGHDVIMTPGTPCYFDHYQASPVGEPLAIGGYNPLKKVYNYEPVPEVLNANEAKHILGSQGNLWTEYIPTSAQAEYMAFPRAIALAEVNWSPREARNWDNFTYKLNRHFNRLSVLDLNFSKSSNNAIITTVYDSISKNRKVVLESDNNLGTKYYCIGNIESPKSFKKYKKPFLIKETAEIHAELRMDGKQAGNKTSRQVFVHEGYGINPDLNTKYSNEYAANGSSSLTDGLRGHPNSLRYDWLGFHGEDAGLVIDLGKESDISNINIGFLHNPSNWIFIPTDVEILLSADGNTYLPAGGLKPDLIVVNEPVTVDFNQVKIDTKARFVKIIVHNRGVCPEGHAGHGEKAWLFIDEVMINQPNDKN
ncbi:MAG: family 20 glycosylhydrolase [Lentimicrobium sp.]|nr:family 20 glycosylhydrolase [Lentimicrobium sp.]